MSKSSSFLIADPDQHSRMLLSEVLRAAGYFIIYSARDGNELLEKSIEYRPRVVFTGSRIHGISGLEYTRLIRAGYADLSRQTSIIVMTDTPTKSFLTAAQESGADEMLARPFSSQAVLVRLKSVLDRPRRFVDCASYIGPCRRRRMLEAYHGPKRRFTDPLDDPADLAPWETESNRAVVRACIRKISELALNLTPGDRRKLREVYAAAKETEEIADSVRDKMMGDAARSLGRYIVGVGASGLIEVKVLTTHIDAMHTLSVLTNQHNEQREQLITSLQTLVDKKLARLRAPESLAVSRSSTSNLALHPQHRH